MKKRSQNKPNVTLNELYRLVKSGFAQVEGRFGLVEARMDQRFGAVNEHLKNIDVRLDTLGRDVSKTKNLVLDVQDEVVSLNVAIENDAKRYFDHDRRISRLEKARA